MIILIACDQLKFFKRKSKKDYIVQLKSEPLGNVLLFKKKPFAGYNEKLRAHIAEKYGADVLFIGNDII